MTQVINLETGEIEEKKEQIPFSESNEANSEIINLDTGRIERIASNEYANSTIGGVAETSTGFLFNPEQVLPAKGDSSTIAQLKAAFSDDPQNMLKILAQSRFPNNPNAANRYGFKDGRVVYIDNTGRLREEDSSWLMGFIGEGAAPMIGGGVGSIVGPGGAFLGASFGESINKLTGNALGDEQTPEGNAIDIALEGVLSWLGYNVADKGVKLWNQQRARNITPDQLKEARELGQAADNLGIELDAAQKTNLPSLKGESHVLRMGVNEAADIYQKFDKRQDSQVIKAVDDWLTSISPNREQVSAGTRAIRTSEEILSEAKQARSNAASPLYEAARAEDTVIDVNPVIDLINNKIETAKGPARNQLNQIKSFFYKEGETGLELDTSVSGLHNAKIAIDDLLATNPANETALKKTAKAAAMDIKQSLLKQLEASPNYMKALNTFKDNSPQVNAIEESIIGVLSKFNPIQADSIAQKIFGAKTPNTIRQAKAMIQQKDPALWDDLMGAWLEGEILATGKTNIEGDVIKQGAKIAQNLTNPVTLRKIKAAMSVEQYESFDSLMKVLRATGRTQHSGSRTAFNAETIDGMRSDASPWVRRGLNALEFWRIPSRVADWWANAQLPEYSRKLAEMMTSKDSLDMLKELRKVKPNSEKALQIIGSAMFLTSKDLAASTLRPYNDQIPQPEAQQ